MEGGETRPADEADGHHIWDSDTKSGDQGVSLIAAGGRVEDAA